MPKCATTSPSPKIPLDQLDPATTPVLSVPEGGAYFGMDRDRAYRAAKSGYLPTVQVSERRWVVPTAALLRLLTGGAAE